MLLSIVIATFKRPRELAEALKSTVALLPMRFEIIIADDSPGGEGQKIAEDARAKYELSVKYIKRELPTGGKPALVRNEASIDAIGKYLYFLDDDDCLIAEGIKAAINALELTQKAVAIGKVRPFSRAENGADAVQQETQFFESARNFLVSNTRQWRLVSQLNFGTTVLVCSSCVIKSSVFKSIGGFDASIPLCEDVEMFQRAIELGGYTFVDKELLLRSCGESSLITNATQQKLNESYKLIQKSFKNRVGFLKFYFLKVLFKCQKILEK